MEFVIDTKFNQLLRERERLHKEKIDFEELSKKIGVNVDTLEAFNNSHITSIVDITVTDFIKVVEYFNVNLEDFIEYHIKYD